LFQTKEKKTKIEENMSDRKKAIETNKETNKNSELTNLQ
jgi:hypothetical protein